ncbi:hypothetical protein M427DRAFT_60534 [Gonapodya prolifera JEL478]|uniref:Uncharacterized protein n=1 Tax=Gonapodya prolifera (strain JEL478) TaxID=1344416 RepID=A0A139A542_GONPJ|nr:hypothetical protein M427DRAFT_60534 [Gonapodya prolifera JEL478]|eukprot:KXS11503.1 hypothetical protein M427DRAFT_60534 [Gonapodya prolifera JEL478]
MLDAIRYCSGCPKEFDATAPTSNQRRQIYQNMGLAPFILHSWVQTIGRLSKSLYLP